MPGFTKSSQASYYSFLFGDGSDGDSVINANTPLPSILNGPIVEKKFNNLVINENCILSVTNPCQGLLIRVRNTLMLNGTLSMSAKAGAVPGGGADLFLHYSDIKIQRNGAQGGKTSGAPGADGTDGQGGGGGAGGIARFADKVSNFGAGADGFLSGGGQGGGGGCAGTWPMFYTQYYNIWDAGNAQPYGQGYGDWGGWVQNGQPYPESEGISINGRGSKGGVLGGGVLIVMARQIFGNGLLTADGSGAVEPPADYRKGECSGGGGAGGGIIVVFYGTAQALNMRASGGPGTLKSTNTGADGGRGGNGSCRA